METEESKSRRITVTDVDHRRLSALLSDCFTQALVAKPNIHSLRGELATAEIIDPQDVPPNVVTMNSVVQLRELGSDQIETYTLVYPNEAKVAAGKLSVLAPIGTAILGYRAGDVVEWKVPEGVVRICIEAVISQPENEQTVP